MANFPKNCWFALRGKATKGFTLIELLVAMTIIGLLAAAAGANYMTSLKRGRDTQRRSDLNQYRIALENYAANNNGNYPSGIVLFASGPLCASYLLPNYMSSCLEDPRSPARYYTYRSDSDSAAPPARRYVLYIYGGLEIDPNTNWVVCWDGKVGVVTNTDPAIWGAGGYCPM